MKAAKSRDYTFVKNNHQNNRSIKAINLTTAEEHYFPSLYLVEKNLGEGRGLVRRICMGEYGCKSGRSKFDDYYYRFEYLD